MMNRSKVLVGYVIALLICVGCGTRIPGIDPNVYVEEIKVSSAPNDTSDDGFIDDLLENKHTTFDADLVDRRRNGDWLINQSEAVIRLDVPLAKPDEDKALLELHASYVAANGGAKGYEWMNKLPSINMLDGKAKQFDDGLYAAIDQAHLTGRARRLRGHIDLISKMLERAGPDSVAAPFLAAGLRVVGEHPVVSEIKTMDSYVRKFEADASNSKPLGFYTWTTDLQRCWKLSRYFQQPLGDKDPVLAELASVLRDEPALRAEYEKTNRLYSRLSNPLERLNVADVANLDVLDDSALARLRADRGTRELGVAFLPASTSRETELFRKLFPYGVPEGVNLMKSLVTKIRSGEVDLTPRHDSGWYDHQVYALESMLLPERGEESNKLFLTKGYKRRMLEAFQALLTKRRETHMRQSGAPTAAAEPLTHVEPRLRVEPCPTYYLRTGRSYAFLRRMLRDTLGEETLNELTGLREGGERKTNLSAELDSMRDLFFGFYVVSCDDIGMRPKLTAEDFDMPDVNLASNSERAEFAAKESERCYQASLAWLEKLTEDEDLSQDTRVAVPIYVDPIKNKTRLWVTLGVRMSKLDASYLKLPRMKAADNSGDWEPVERWKTQSAEFLIAVDEFAEVEIPSLSPPNRAELRAVCDKYKTKQAIVGALSSGKY